MNYVVFCLISIVSFTVYADPLIIAHRGASGYYPEHTLEAYRAAIEMGADYIEPDLVVTADGELIARHDLFLSTSTNVERVFPVRKTTIDGNSDWFVSEFTVAEIRQLKARQTKANRDKGYDDQFQIPTFDEILMFVAQMERRTGRPIGIYPELKHPTFFQSIGHDMGTLLLTALNKHGRHRDVFIQSFDPQILKTLDQQTELPLVMLVMPASRLTPHKPNIPLVEVAEFADGVGAMKYMLLDRGGKSSGFIEKAREYGLFVHAWTFRDDQLDDRFDSPAHEIESYLALGIDGLFTDFPDTAIRLMQSTAAP